MLSDSQGSLPADISSADKLARVPGAVRVVQNAGEAIFVPRYCRVHMYQCVHVHTSPHAYHAL